MSQLSHNSGARRKFVQQKETIIIKKPDSLEIALVKDNIKKKLSKYIERHGAMGPRKPVSNMNGLALALPDSMSDHATSVAASRLSGRRRRTYDCKFFDSELYK